MDGGLRDGDDPAVLGAAMHALLRELYPICRSITGDGVRRTLARLKQDIPLQVHEVPSGTPVFAWTVPREWSIRDAYVKDDSGLLPLGKPPHTPRKRSRVRSGA